MNETPGAGSKERERDVAQPNREQRRQRRGVAENRLEAIYVKSNACRVIHADGAYGGLTPQLNIYMALYSEHNALPASAVYVLDPAEKTAREETQAPPREWTREIEAEVIMSRDMARSLRDWLDARIKAVEEVEANPDAAFKVQSIDTAGNA